MSAAHRRKRNFAFKPTHILLLLVVFSVSVAATTAVTSRMSQLALGNQADLLCTANKDYTYPCGQKNPKTKKIGGKDCPCNDNTQGHITPGKCQGPNICKGEPPGGGKMPEMPTMPEPPKDSPSSGSNQTPCPARGIGLESGSGGMQTREGATSSTFDANGQPCPTEGGNPVSSFISGILGGDIPTTLKTAPTTTSRFSWTAVTRVVQDVKNVTNAVTDTVTNVVTGAVRTAITTLGGNQAPIVRPPDAVKDNGTTTNDMGRSVAPEYFTSPDLNTFGAPRESVGTNPRSPSTGSIWDWLKDLMRINP